VGELWLLADCTWDDFAGELEDLGWKKEVKDFCFIAVGFPDEAISRKMTLADGL
jgi:hypothetical protein